MEATNRPEIPKALTLSQFSAYVARALSREPVLYGAWVAAEISDLSTSGGHCYMTLIEKDPAGTTVARMRATIWASRFFHIRNNFRQQTGHELANGMKVMLHGGANYHSSYGLSFNVNDIDPSYSLGDLERIRREILETLRREGVIELNRRLRIEEPPLKVAVISSESAAGYGDFVNQLAHNPSGAIFYTHLFPAAMQGEKTASSVISALDLVKETASIMHWDCVAIIRGGGATTDMNGFDDMQLARKVATFPIPVIVGIGHERDRCVLDEIACIRCKTPTAVAAFLSDSVAAAWQKAADLSSMITTYATERLKGEHIRLQGLQSILPALADSRISNARLLLQRISATLPGLAREATSKERVRIENIATTLRIAADNRVEKEKTKLENIKKLISVLDPAATLARGYSITRLGGKAISKASDVKPGDILVTTLSDGSVTSQFISCPDTTAETHKEPK